MSPKQKGAGGKLKRTEIVTVRLDPKLRYGVELAARKHRRTASSFIEWAVEKTLEQFPVRESSDPQWDTMMKEVLDEVWDVDEPDRLAKLALNFPELLSHEEQVLWKVIREYGFLWRGRWVPHGDEEKWTWQFKEEDLNFRCLREHWDVLKSIAQGNASMTELPSWSERRQNPAKVFEEDIPF